MATDYTGPHSGYTFENVVASVEYIAERTGVASLHDAAALLRSQAAEIERLREAQAWQPIETAPQDGYMLVHEDEAIRALLRINGAWHRAGYPAIVAPPWGDVLVGDDAKRMLPPGYRLELRDGCCESPTHWLPLPAPPQADPEPAR